MDRSPRDAQWPELPYAAWRPTYETLHRWVQVVGKIRLAVTPWLNHSWHVPLYVSARGLRTPAMPHGAHVFDMAFDFVEHRLDIRVSDGGYRAVPLCPQSVATFYAATMNALADLGMPVAIDPTPCELLDALPFDQDHRHASYDPEYAWRFARVLSQAYRVLFAFRTAFLGKCSPVHFFWGSFDLAVTRFSGRRAPPHPGGVPHLPDAVAREAYSHEVSSAGFWPGGEGAEYPAFYSYAYPQPEGFAQRPVHPQDAFFSEALGEFILPYDAVRTASDPDQALLAFLQTTYAAAADAAGWDRAALECAIGRPGVPRAVPPP